MPYVIGVDIGGTFTDCVIADDSGHLTLGKSLSTPDDFSAGVVKAVSVVAGSMGLSLGEVLADTSLFLHSTTVAENAVVDGKLAKAGLLLTRGFQHTLVFSRGGYGRWAGLTVEEKKDLIHTDKPDPVVPIGLTRPITERTDSQGAVVRGVDEAEVEAAVHELVEQGAEAIGISFLWSCVNGANEAAVRAIVERLYPGCFVTAGHEIAPTLGEFERTQTAALNVRLGPLVAEYVRKLEERLSDAGFAGSLLVMQAYGGLIGADEAGKRGVGLIESGPVAGLMGSRWLGNLIGHENILTADMGGTTFKAGVIREALIEYQREPLVYRYPYSIPKMDVISVGIAGGSVVSIDEKTGRPQIGPRSAGSYPGPACYGFGGQEATVTDVDLLLGYLNPRYFAEGDDALNVERAREVFAGNVAEPLGLELEEALQATYRLTNSLLYDWLHKLTVERGLDPAQYVLFAYGGTAGMHLVTVAEQLGLQKAVVPYSAAVHSAFGLVTGDVTHELQVTQPTRATAGAAGSVEALFHDLAEQAVADLRREGFEDGEIVLSRSIDMRFQRQLHQVSVPVASQNGFGDRDLDETVDVFERMYKERYGEESAYREAGVEMVTFRLRAVGRLPRPDLERQELEGPDPSAALVETRTIYADKIGRSVEAPSYDFGALKPGNRVEGPAVIWTPITTIVLNPGQVATCDEYKNVVVTWAPAANGGADGS